MKIRTKISIIIVSLLVISCFTENILAKTAKEATEEIKSVAKIKGLSEVDVSTSVSVLSDLIAKGVPVEDALVVVKSAIDRNCSGPEIASIAKSLCDTVEKEGSAKEIATIAKICVEEGLKGEEIAKVMLKVQVAMRKDTSARQLRILTKDLLDNGCNANGLCVAIESVGKCVEQGFSPDEARKSVALVAIKGLKDGLRGEELADKIRKEAQYMEQHREQYRERYGETKGLTEDIKDRIKTPDATVKPSDTGGGDTNQYRWKR